MTDTSDSADRTEHVVVVNDEEQYSIWPAERPVPAGWHPAGQRGDRQACLDWIDEHWTDMRPKSLRQALGRR
ncbi:MbtH family protein [Actinoplanes teichomyceticus]|uniref:MbtH protein n=1 Tax=Actinoplanes teichomyceticus TaxID=1867 RepID=A0A561VIC2_ACTTI|nr:MbtH family NRPS accessory protein [Actinoplanes teichomyceticus]TWG11361.1 MbtH protein [Actinoplanes teichomyceticus]GIF15824.1 antibiotic synthesis protein MbtH [Actinoplanes teichomyceticus]